MNWGYVVSALIGAGLYQVGKAAFLRWHKSRKVKKP